MPISKHRRRRARSAPRTRGPAAAQPRVASRRRKRNWLYLITSGIIAVLVIAGFAIGGANFGGGGALSRSGSAEGYVEGIGVEQTLMRTASHVAQGVTVEYNTVPPTSGDHWGVVPGTPASCGFYEDGQPDERIVHNLEHGHIVISYNLATEEEVAALREAVDRVGLSAIWGVTRFYDKLPEGTVAIAAWGVLDEMQGVDRERIKRFYEAYAGNLGPERLVC